MKTSQVCTYMQNLVSKNVSAQYNISTGEHTKLKSQQKIKGKYLFTHTNHGNKPSVYANLVSKNVICLAVQSGPPNFSIYFRIAVLV